MKKILLSIGCLVLSLLANELVVKKDDVVGMINGKQVNFKKGNSLILTEGTQVCYKGGKGRLIVNKKKQLFSKSKKKCYQVPIPKGFDLKLYGEKAKEMFIVAFIDSDDKVVNGVSTKGIKSLNSKGNIELSHNKKELIIASDKYGPLPVVLNLKDKSGNIVSRFINEENNITFFKIDSSIIKTGYKIEILDGFSTVIVEKNIIKN